MDVMKAYTSWSYFRPKPKLTIVYGTMYGFVGRLAEAVALKVDGVEVLLLDVSKHYISDVMGELIDSAEFALGMPTYEGGIFPPIRFLIELILHKRFEPRPFGFTHGEEGLPKRLGRCSSQKVRDCRADCEL